MNTFDPSVWRSSCKTAKRPRLDWTRTNQDQKFSGLIRTVTVVRSLVHQHFQKLKTEQRPVLAVLTGLYSPNLIASWARVITLQINTFNSKIHILIRTKFVTRKCIAKCVGKYWRSDQRGQPLLIVVISHRLRLSLASPNLQMSQKSVVGRLFINIFD